MLAVTAIADYHLSFADQGKQTFVFLSQQTKGTSSVSSIFRRIYPAVSNRKRKHRQFSLTLFTVCALYKQKFAVCPFVDKETNGSYPFANGLNASKRTSMETWLQRRSNVIVCVSYATQTGKTLTTKITAVTAYTSNTSDAYVARVRGLGWNPRTVAEN
jgi:hypothetical protein